MTVEHGLPANNVFTIVEASDGSIWFGTDDGVSRLMSDDKWLTYTSRNGLASNSVTFIVEASDGSFWFATRSGISHLDQAYAVITSLR